MPRTMMALAVAGCFAGGVSAQGWTLDTTRSSGFPSSATSSAYPTSDRVVPRLINDFRIANVLGPTVAVIDTGVNVQHVLFRGRLAPGSIEVFGSTDNVTDSSGHGTAVASMVLSQSGGTGDVLGARVLPIRVFNGPTASQQNLADGLRYSVGRAPIVNMSLSAPGPIAQAAMMESVAAGQLVVVAGGNSALANPEWPARFAKDGWAGGRIIAVGAVDANNAIASFSNRAGDTKNAFMVAPGIAVPGASAFSMTGMVSMSGTSAAAPIVAGAAASILAHWPYLSAERIAGVLFASATDLGAPGVDEVFGWGLLNLNRALLPIGTATLSLASGSSVPINTAAFSPGVVAGAGLRTAAARGELIAIGLDRYGRAYQYDLGAGFAVPQRMTADQLVGAIDRTVGYSRTTTSTNGRVTVGIDAAPARSVAGQLYEYESRDKAQTALSGLSMVQRFGANLDLAGGLVGMGESYFGVNAVDRDHASAPHAAGPILALPMLQLIPSHSHLAAGYALPHGLTLKIGLVSSATADAARDQIAPASVPSQKANAYMLEVATVGGLGTLGATVQHLRESGAYFGSTGGDAYRVSATPATTAATLFVRFGLAKDWAFAGQYTLATTPGFQNNGDSLIAQVSASQTRAYALGVSRSNLIVRSDRIALTFTQPLRAASGVMSLDLPTGIDATGQVLRTARAIALKPSGRERLTELRYTRSIGKASTASVVAVHRADPNHDALAPAERVGLVRFSSTF
jgi:Subtilase family